MDIIAHLKVVIAWRRLLERQALPTTVLAVLVVEVEVREGKENEALNREIRAVVEESEDEGRLVQIARCPLVRSRCCHILGPAAQVDLAKRVSFGEAVHSASVVRVVLRTGCHLDLQVDLGQGSTWGVPNLSKLADVRIKQHRF